MHHQMLYHLQMNSHVLHEKLWQIKNIPISEKNSHNFVFLIFVHQ